MKKAHNLFKVFLKQVRKFFFTKVCKIVKLERKNQKNVCYPIPNEGSKF